MNLPPSLYSPKDHEKTLAYCVTLGAFGSHRYYVGRHLSATILCTITVLTCVGLGWLGTAWLFDQRYLAGLSCYLALMVIVAVWPLIDFLALLRGTFKDADGLPLAPSEKKHH